MTTAVRQLFELDKLVDQGAGSDCLPLLRQIQDTLTQVQRGLAPLQNCSHVPAQLLNGSPDCRLTWNTSFLA